MTFTLKKILAISLFGGTLSLAMAQTPAPPQAADGMAGQRSGHMQQHMYQNMHQNMGHRHAQFLAELKTNLQLNPSQEGAWTSFAAAMQPPADMQHRQHTMRSQHAELEKLTTPERIDKQRVLRQDRMARMNTELTRREDAAKSFYATLGASQQKVFDAAHWRLMRMQHGRRGMGGSGHHG
jgi:periplasmic protein CpxP/Spy